MNPSFRVRFTVPPFRSPRPPSDVQTTDVRSDLDHLPGELPANAYIVSIEDLAVGEYVHWSRWPKAYRPGFGAGR
ncbi:MAG TPA: hypothetical protein VHR66_21315 [Gemmataceae bacterium]|jgi:hypothetical protein|nr:hypothetical protein [Gemmataceae bacterium]